MLTYLKLIYNFLVFIVILPLICLFYYGLPTYLFWIFSTFMALNFQDIFYCITAKYIIEHKIMHYEEYKVLCCLIFVSVYLIFTLQTDYHTDYWQTAFVGSYYFNRVRIFRIWKIIVFLGIIFSLLTNKFLSSKIRHI